MIKVFKIRHTLKERLYDGTLKNFDNRIKDQVSEVIGDDETDAIAKLKNTFNMLHLDIIGKPEMYELTEEEYESRE